MSFSKLQPQTSFMSASSPSSDHGVSETKQATKRSRWKCTECRRKRIRCYPQNRDWQSHKEKCNECVRVGHNCGPNVLAPSSQNKLEKIANPGVPHTDAALVPVAGASNHLFQSGTPANHGGYPSFGLPAPISSDFGLAQEWEFEGLPLSPQNNAPPTATASSLTLQDEVATPSFTRLGELRKLYASLLDLLHTIAPYETGNDNSPEPKRSLETIACILQYVYKDTLLKIVKTTRSWTDHDAELVLLKTLKEIHRFQQIAQDPGIFEDSELKIHSTILQRLISIYRSKGDDSEVELLLMELVRLPGSCTNNSGIPEQLAQAFQATSKRAAETLRGLHLGSTIKANLDLTGTDPFPAFQRAIRVGYPDVVRIFCGMVPQTISTLDILEQHDLHIAAEQGDITALDAIILSQPAAAAINCRDVLGRTPLCLAALTGKLEAVKRLVHANGDPRLRDRSARNSLHYACAGGWVDVVGYLLNCGVSPNDNTAIQPPPLHVAAAAGSHEICRLLLDHHAHTDDHNGTSAEDAALQSGHAEIAAMIRSAGKRSAIPLGAVD